MNKASLVFSAITLCTVCAFAFTSEPSITWQIGTSLFLIAIFGIPHGAIDHVLFMKNTRLTPVWFYLFYLGLMALYLGLWLILPQASFILFLLISAFHFGQSQFSDVNFKAVASAKMLYFFWGISILSGMVVYQMPRLSILMIEHPDKLPIFEIMQDYNIFNTVLIGSTIVTHALFMWSAFAGDMRPKRLIAEVLIFGLIHFCFYALPMLVGFTLYFALMHSLKVLGEEFDFIKQKDLKFNLLAFIKMLVPYTILSLFGIGTTILLAQLGIIEANSLLLGLIFISILTLPHSLVMNNFYKKLYAHKAAHATPTT